jgi:hypothetical protein
MIRILGALLILAGAASANNLLHLPRTPETNHKNATGFVIYEGMSRAQFEKQLGQMTYAETATVSLYSSVYYVDVNLTVEYSPSGRIIEFRRDPGK